MKYGIAPPISSKEAKRNENNSNMPTIQMSTMFNATARPPHQLTVLTGDEITTRMKNLGQLTWNHPMERGMICDGETQLRVWARTLEVLGVVPTPQIKGGGGFLATQGASAAKKKLAAAAAAAASASSNASTQKYSSNDCTFLLLEPPHVPSVISEGVDCILFRELGIGRVARVVGPCMAAVKFSSVGSKRSTSDSSSHGDDTTKSDWVNDDTNCCCVIDSGYSFTHVVPTHRGGAITKAIRRLDIGGKVLTNLLKEAVTYRQWNMMDEYHIVNDAKEQLSFVSDKFDSEMKAAHVTRKGLRWFDREYLLPDFVSSSRGSVRLPAPLQRKIEMEKMEQMKLELERKKKEEEEKQEEDEGNDQQTDDKAAAEDGVEMEVDDKSAKDSNTQKEKKPDSKRQKIEKGKKKTKKRSKKRKQDFKQSDDEDEAEMSDGDDSDEESDQQRLKRLKAMREEERKRREREERERQALAMSVERFAIPEVLFRPSDIGMNCGGIVEAIVESINACDEIYRAAMYNNVLLVGGNATIPGFRVRVESELRKLAPTNYPVRVYLPNNPVSFAWEGAVQFSQQDGFQKQFSIDRVSWEAMKKAGKDQSEIWGELMYNIAQN